MIPALFLSKVLALVQNYAKALQRYFEKHSVCCTHLSMKTFRLLICLKSSKPVVFGTSVTAYSLMWSGKLRPLAIASATVWWYLCLIKKRLSSGWQAAHRDLLIQVSFLLLPFTRTSLSCTLLKLEDDIFYSGTTMAWAEGSLWSLFLKLNTEMTIYIYTYFYLKRNKPHFSPPVQLKVSLSLQACYTCLSVLSHWVKVYLCSLWPSCWAEVGPALHQRLLAVRDAQCSL